MRRFKKFAISPGVSKTHTAPSLRAQSGKTIAAERERVAGKIIALEFGHFFVLETKHQSDESRGVCAPCLDEFGVEALHFADGRGGFARAIRRRRFHHPLLGELGVASDERSVFDLRERELFSKAIDTRPFVIRFRSFHKPYRVPLVFSKPVGMWHTPVFCKRASLA